MLIKTLKTTTYAIAVTMIAFSASSYESQATGTVGATISGACQMSMLGDRLSCDRLVVEHMRPERQRVQPESLSHVVSPPRAPGDENVGEGGGGGGGGGR